MRSSGGIHGAGVSSNHSGRTIPMAALGVIANGTTGIRSEEHTSELQSLRHLVCCFLPTSSTHIYPLSLPTLFRSGHEVVFASHCPSGNSGSAELCYFASSQCAVLGGFMGRASAAITAAVQSLWRLWG